MKRILVIFIAVCCALCLSGCFGTRESDLPYATDRAAEEDISYSALNISVVAQTDVKNEVEYYTLYNIGVSFMGGVLDEDSVIYAMNNAANNLGIVLEPLTYEIIYDERNEDGGNYDYYTFLVHQEYPYPLSYVDTDYGFFYARHRYSLVAPTWINGVKKAVFSRINSLFNSRISAGKSSVEIDPDCVRFRYYLVGDKLEAEGATAVRYANITNSIMWEVSGDDYDFTELSVTQKVMMEGWDIVPIILGVVVVLVLFGWCLVAKMFKKPDNVSEIFDTSNNHIDGQ